jgi:mannose-6-phosphate isomerase-like protein (cupin superfamily)
MEHFADVDARSAFASEKMKKNNLFTTPRMFCDVYCFEAGQMQAGHTHAGSDKVYYVIEGQAQIRVGDEERTVTAGATALAPSGMVHAVTNPGPQRLRLLVFMAPPP